MIDDEDHPEYLAVRNALFQQAATIAAHEPFGRALIQKLQELCASATAQARKRGVVFPDMVVVYFKYARLIRIWRRDADQERVTAYVRLLIKEAPEVVASGDIFGAVRAAYPSYIFTDIPGLTLH